MTAFEEQQERMRRANEQLRDNLLMLRDAAGSDASHVLLFNVRSAGIGTVSEVIETLMACVDALSSRIFILEENVKAAAN